MPKLEGIQKVLVIGSGPIIIGQAAEFDYAGTQACLALKEEGCEVVLLNNNPATIMTDPSIADTVYFEPITVESAEKIIESENPDGLLATLGGQTGLNLALDLYNEGILQKYNLKLLGTEIESIMKGEDREAFRELMHELGEPVAESEIVETVDEAIKFADTAGFPLIIRPAYTLGGSGGGFADTSEDLAELAAGGLRESPIHQCLIEKSMKGYKEIEYEVMRDGNNTCITICNMENVDPVGVHTGDSIVVAPSQTLTDTEYHKLRAASLKIIRALDIIGGCNIQFALNPYTSDYYIIEVNPRVSRSSALASKATGYPIARIAAKLCLGYHLHELINPVTGHTYASFEPALDYVAVKFPRWPFDKFSDADRKLGTQMKATGEVMAIDRSLVGGFQKAVRSLDMKTIGLGEATFAESSEGKLWEHVENATDLRFFAVLELMRRGVLPEKIYEKSRISLFFLDAFKRMVQGEKKAKLFTFPEVDGPSLLELKKLGCSDEWLAAIWGTDTLSVWKKRRQLGILPSYRKVDTCAAEFEAESAYYYSSWGGKGDIEPSEGKKMLVIGSGPIRIGQGIEFDYCSVHAVQALQAEGYKTIMINNNPETVSTDYTLADRLYFEPLAFEDVLNVAAFEEVDGVIVQVGGQTSISLVKDLERAGIPVLGVNANTIDQLEDRDLFYRLMEKLHIPHIPGLTAYNEIDLVVKADEVGYPVLLRPSYVIGGQGMVIIESKQEMETYIKQSLSKVQFPILIDAYISGTEAEVDVLTDGGDVLIPGFFEHIEKAGVHSGDSTAVTPPFSLTNEVKSRLENYTKVIARAINFQGIFNVQFVVSNQKVYVLEINPRASRTVPILSKVYDIDMIGIAVKLMLGKSIAQLGYEIGCLEEPPYFTVKFPVFSTGKLPGVDPLLGPEMKSTGEGIAISETYACALGTAMDLTFQPGDECFCLVDESGWGRFEKLSDLLHEAGVVLVSDDVRFSRCFGLKKEASFHDWIRKKEARALINLGSRSGKQQRMIAVRNRLKVITEETQVESLLVKRTESREMTPIGHWLKKKEGSFSH
ncbi:MAG TPA: carbamoyl phosphate synthase large subunit [Bacillales bacterium]|nr:carbamoyl phosphate synthase large subunit [Bacillales bacterium]